VFKTNENPGPGQYESISPRVKSTIIRKDYNPNATVSTRVPARNIPGPGNYQYDYSFGSQQMCFVDTKPRKSGNRFSSAERRVFDCSKSQYIPGPG